MIKSYIIILECIYLFYIFRHFKTSTNFSYDLYIKNQYLQHPVGFHDEKILQICQFGQDAILVLIGIFLLRLLLPIKHIFIKGAIIIALIISLINLNAVVYLLPVVLLEFLILKN